MHAFSTSTSISSNGNMDLYGRYTIFNRLKSEWPTLHDPIFGFIIHFQESVQFLLKPRLCCVQIKYILIK